MSFCAGHHYSAFLACETIQEKNCSHFSWGWNLVLVLVGMWAETGFGNTAILFQYQFLYKVKGCWNLLYKTLFPRVIFNWLDVCFSRFLEVSGYFPKSDLSFLYLTCCERRYVCNHQALCRTVLLCCCSASILSYTKISPKNATDLLALL